MTGRPSLWRIYSDLFWAWVVRRLTPAPRGYEAFSLEDHRLLATRYAELAAQWRRWGRVAHAAALDARARDHRVAAGGDDLPPAASMGLPRRRSVVSDVRGTVVRGPWRGGRGPRSMSPAR